LPGRPNASQRRIEAHALVITALCFRAAWTSAGPVWERSLWMTLCVLAKQPQIVFVLLELMAGRLRALPRRWSSLAIVVLPGIILSPLWVVGVSADVAAWRVREGHNYPAEQFDLLWKLSYMWEHPFHFPLAAWTAISEWGAPLWPELIGILAWQDVLLRPWTYLVLTVLLLLAPLQKLPLDGATRARVAVMTGSYIVIGLSDLFPHLHACRFAPCLGRSRTLLRHRPAYGCDLHGLADQPRTTARHARADRDYRLNDCGDHDRGRVAGSPLVMCQGADMCSTWSLRSAAGHSRRFNDVGARSALPP
jgi:hypothetical protein